MCKDCGCDSPSSTREPPASAVPPSSGREPRASAPDQRRIIEIHKGILDKNNQLATTNRLRFQELGIHVVNVLSSPGSGKTALLERTLADLGEELRSAVIVGDLATDNDARRLDRTGVPVVQITTGTVCHLDAGMIARALTRLDLEGLDLLWIENVGNLVCPAVYDLGEAARVVLMSVTEGEDKPLKYSAIFRDATVVLLSKIDLAAAVEFDRATALDNLRRVAPGAVIFEVSARTGQGLASWYDHVRSQFGRMKAEG